VLLLHISDIHFRAPDCLDPNLDPERPYRTRLLQDLRRMVAELGPVGAILIGGDVAFRGASNEYETALVWIKELAAVAGCPMERVFVVPGNHDVDRNIARTAAVRNVHNAIARSAPEARERELRNQISDSDTKRALVAPIAAYNEFAKILNCQVYLPERLYWKQDLDLEDGVVLRLHGLNSTLLSGIDGVDDTRQRLYLSPLQTVLDPVDDVVNLVLCHHPPDWLLDHDDVEDAICGRASIHMFGHKHRQRIRLDSGFIRFSAGAVNPDRYEAGWVPGYNLVEMHIRGNGKDRVLTINAYLRQWQPNSNAFQPVLTQDDKPVFKHEIRFPEAVPRRVATVLKDQPIGTNPVAPVAEVDEQGRSGDMEAAMGNPSTRNLVFRFWNLTSSQRRDIAVTMGLIRQDELQLPEPERYGRALIRAGERGQLEELAREVARRETADG
jgi:predicted MPP superfamily phosphohydrolase